MSKTAIQAQIHDLTGSLPGKSYNSFFLHSDEFYQDENHHQIYRLKSAFQGSELNVRFRTKSSDPRIDDLLSILQESLLVRECSGNHFQEGNLTTLQKLGSDISEYLIRCKPDSITELRYLPRSAQNKFIRMKLAVLIDAMEYLMLRGQSYSKSIALLKELKIYPIKNEQKDEFIEQLLSKL